MIMKRDILYVIRIIYLPMYVLILKNLLFLWPPPSRRMAIFRAAAGGSHSKSVINALLIGGAGLVAQRPFYLRNGNHYFIVTVTQQ